MKFSSQRGFIVWMVLLLATLEINGAQIKRRKREANEGGENDLNWETILEGVHKIPLIGNGLYKGFQDAGNTVHQLDKLTNGALARIVGGYPPCIIDLEGIECKGKPENGGIVGITKELVNGTALPDIAKIMINDVLDAVVFPFFDSIFGIPEKSGRKAA